MQKKRIVIIGGGFAGAKLAKRLESLVPQDWDIFLLSKVNFITYNPLLPEVVGASLLPGHVQAPLRLMLKRTKIRMVKVDEIDLENKIIHYHNNEPGQINYDELVFANGVESNSSIIPGLAEHALPLKTVGDALYIRNKMIERLEQATIHPDPEVRKQLCTFIVMGGGFSGVEVAGEMDDFLKSAERFYKNVKREDCRIILMHSRDRLLPELSEKLGIKTQKIFEKRGIEVLLNTRITAVENERVIVKDQQPVDAGTIICTIGTQPQAANQLAGLPLERGKIMTNADMSVKGVPNIWALGDCAIVPNALDGKMCPPTAQFADRQASHLAKNISLYMNAKDTKAFSYKPTGMLASIGHNKAVAEIYGFRMSGLIAFMLWRGIYLMKIPTLSRKVRLFLEWNWSMFFPPDISHLGFKRSGDK